VLSHAFWTREMGGDPRAIGRTLTLDSLQAEVIGVTPAGFSGLEVGRGFDIAVPLCVEPAINGGNRLMSVTDWWLVAIGRLKPGWTLGRATAQLQAISSGIFETTITPTYPAASAPRYKAFTLEAAPGEAGVSMLRQAYEDPLWMLLAAAGMLLIACANLANLLLARASARHREIAVRLGLGASRARIVRQLLTESALVAAIGAAGGVLLAAIMGKGLVSFLSTEGNAVVLQMRTDWRVLAFASSLGLLTCLLFGVTPALRATGRGSMLSLRTAGRGVIGVERHGLRRTLVAAQVALSLVLIAAGILFARSLWNLRHVDTGFRREGVLVASLDLRRLDVPIERRHDRQRDLLARIRAVPGVRGAAFASVIPVSGSSSGNRIWLEGTTMDVGTNINRISPGYFDTMDIPILSGRDFDDRDTMSAPMVAIVNQTFAQRLTGGADPVGRRFRVEATPTTPEVTYEIVGLARNAIYQFLREQPRPLVFLAAAQTVRPGTVVQLVIHSEMPLATVAAGITSALREANPRIAVAFRVFDRQIEDTVVRERLLAMLSIFFAAVAALLALLGLYGVIAYGVTKRTNEIGVRIALGAGQGAVLAMILQEGAVLITAGIAAGLVIALAAGKLAASLLYGITPHEPATLATAAAVLAAAGLFASYWPARAATRIEPTVALRAE
jgi:predicted permease